MQPDQRTVEPAAPGKTRTYYVAADEVSWDYAPSGHDEAMVRDLTDMADRLSYLGGSSLKRDIQRIRPELAAIQGKSAAEILG